MRGILIELPESIKFKFNIMMPPLDTAFMPRHISPGIETIYGRNITLTSKKRGIQTTSTAKFTRESNCRSERERERDWPTPSRLVLLLADHQDGNTTWLYGANW